MTDENYLEEARKAGQQANIKRIADSLEKIQAATEHIAKFIDSLQGIMDIEYKKKLNRYKKKQKEKKKNGGKNRAYTNLA